MQEDMLDTGKKWVGLDGCAITVIPQKRQIYSFELCTSITIPRYAHHRGSLTIEAARFLSLAPQAQRLLVSPATTSTPFPMHHTTTIATAAHYYHSTRPRQQLQQQQASILPLLSLHQISVFCIISPNQVQALR